MPHGARDRAAGQNLQHGFPFVIYCDAEKQMEGWLPGAPPTVRASEVLAGRLTPA